MKNGDRSNPWFILLAKQKWFQELCNTKWESVSLDVKNAIQEEKNILMKYSDDLTKKYKNAINNANTILQWIDNRIKWMDKTFQ